MNDRNRNKPPLVIIHVQFAPGDEVLKAKMAKVLDILLRPSDENKTPINKGESDG